MHYLECYHNCENNWGLLTAVARPRTRVPRAPGRPLTILRWWSGFGWSRTGWQINAHNIIVIMSDANAPTECRCWIRAGSPTGFHRETTGLRARRPTWPSGPIAVDGAICHSNTRTRATLAAVLRWRIIAFPGLTLTCVDFLQDEFSALFTNSTINIFPIEKELIIRLFNEYPSKFILLIL